MGLTQIGAIDATAISVNGLPEDEFDRACVCRLLRHFSMTPCSANAYTNLDLDDFNETAILHFIYKRKDLWYDVEMKKRRIFLELFYFLDIENFVLDCLRKGLRFDTRPTVAQSPQVDTLLFFINNLIKQTQH